jgi:hypothetical protein
MYLCDHHTHVQAAAVLPAADALAVASSVQAVEVDENEPHPAVDEEDSSNAPPMLAPTLLPAAAVVPIALGAVADSGNASVPASSNADANRSTASSVAAPGNTTALDLQGGEGSNEGMQQRQQHTHQLQHLQPRLALQLTVAVH